MTQRVPRGERGWHPGGKPNKRKQRDAHKRHSKEFPYSRQLKAHREAVDRFDDEDGIAS